VASVAKNAKIKSCELNPNNSEVFSSCCNTPWMNISEIEIECVCVRERERERERERATCTAMALHAQEHFTRV